MLAGLLSISLQMKLITSMFTHTSRISYRNPSPWCYRMNRLRGGKVITKMLNMARTKSLFSDYTYKNKPKTYLAKKSHSSLSQHFRWYFTIEIGILAKYSLLPSKYVFCCFPKNVGAYHIFPPCRSMLLGSCSD